MSDTKKNAHATPSERFGSFFQTDASKPKPKATKAKAEAEKLAQPKTEQKPARGRKTPRKTKSPVVVVPDSEGSQDENAPASQAVTPARRRVRTKRTAPQASSPSPKKFKSLDLLVDSTFDDAPVGEATPELTTRSPAPVKRHAVACRECIDKWRTDSSWICEMAESGKRPCVSCEVNGYRCSDDMLEDSRMDVQRVHEMANRHRLGLFVNPESWHTGLCSVLSGVETFDACQRAREVSIQVNEAVAKIERHIREERAELDALKEALKEEKAERRKLEAQVKAMQAQLDDLKAGRDGDNEDDWEDEVDEEGDVGKTQNVGSVE
ncbi:hypothetical protein FAGAP_10403 [Fusarium agapanthi]|uniref:Uncharacterized protein n=1 Tax=Fusarium agapanthi TaxID=1803897 RepID=A0A9P5B197_9HYPO|nr:hypothetical protein FAGAP_10403 [Fusarium agapanthi]